MKMNLLLLTLLVLWGGVFGNSQAEACILTAEVEIINLGNAPFPQIGATIVETDNDKRANVGVALTYPSVINYGSVQPYLDYSTTNSVTHNVSTVTHQTSGFGHFVGYHPVSFKLFRNGDLNSYYANWSRPTTYIPNIHYIDVNADAAGVLTAVKGISNNMSSDICSTRSIVPFINYDPDFITRIGSIEGNACLTGWQPAYGTIVTTNKETMIYHTTDCGHLPTVNRVDVYTKAQAVALGYAKCHWCSI